jgi:hypothetical protein
MAPAGIFYPNTTTCDFPKPTPKSGFCSTLRDRTFPVGGILASAIWPEALPPLFQVSDDPPLAGNNDAETGSDTSRSDLALGCHLLHGQPRLA